MIIFGTGGHAKVLASIVGGRLRGCFDDFAHVSHFNGVEVKPYSEQEWAGKKVVIAIGANNIRKQISTVVTHQCGVIKAASAIVDNTVTIKAGAQVLQGAIIQAQASIGFHTIINTSASVDHDCTIGDFCHIAPNATLCGNVKVGEGTLIGAGAVVIPGIKIGKWCTVGAGSVVIKDIPDNTKVAGNPANNIK